MASYRGGAAGWLRWRDADIRQLPGRKPSSAVTRQGVFSKPRDLICRPCVWENAEASMEVARFNESTGWAGKLITYDENQLVLEGHGPIRAADVIAYDKHCQLAWPRAEMRDWIVRGPSP